MVDVFAGMNDRQQRAVGHTDGPLLVIAGAGSGKTRVITHRIANLIQLGTRPDAILAITFTNKAAGEMRERIEKLLHIKTPWIGTFHSTCLQMLKREQEALPFSSSFNIIDDDDQQRLVKSLIKAKNWSEDIAPKYARWQISQWKNRLLYPEEIKQDTNEVDQLKEIYKLYRAVCIEENLVDFDDLLMLTVRMFRDHPDILKRWQERFPYILIDEYQDTNQAQYELIKQLGAHGNVCATGDPDQAIYGWRGADIHNILNFEKDFKDFTKVLLEENYRSTKTILKAAQSVVENNTLREDKVIFTSNVGGQKIKLISVDDHYEECKAIALRCQSLQEKGRRFGEMAIFYRTNAQSRGFEEELIRRNIPYRLVGGTRFYDRREVKDVLAYCKLMANPRDTISFERVVNIPSRGIGKKTLERLQTRCRALGVGFHDVLSQDELLDELAVGRSASALRDLASVWRRLQNLAHDDASILIEQIIDLCKLDTWYKDQEPGEIGEQRANNIRELQSAALGHGSLEEFLEHVALFTTSDKYDPQADDVVLMTLHASKGLEFPIVFISGCEQGMLPLVNQGREADYEEERRLMYVGITRAKEELYLSHAIVRTSMGKTKRNPPSMFLGEIPNDCIEHRDCTGRVLPAIAGEEKVGPAYPDSSLASALNGATGSELLESLKNQGALQSGSALMGALRGKGSAQGVGKSVNEESEPISFPSDPFRPEDIIVHDIFGEGRVVGCYGAEDNRRIKIVFGGRVIKELALSFALDRMKKK